MVSHVGITDAGRNADHARTRGQQRRFADAKAASSGENAARAINGRIGKIHIRVVDDAVADGGI